MMPGEFRLDAQGDPTSKRFASSETVVARAGDIGTVLVLRPGGTIAGRVRAADGTPVDASVALVPGSDCTNQGMPVGRSPAGAFRFDGLAPCTYSLVAATDEGHCAIVRDLRLASSGLIDDVVLEPVAAARLRIRCAQGEGDGSVDVFQDGLLVASNGVEAGSTMTLTVPAGTLTLQVRKTWAGEKSEQQLVLAVGEERDVVIELVR